MRELSLNILDIAQNSVKAEASKVEIGILAENNLLTIYVSDNGKGMSKEFLASVTDPFTTTRTTRKVGMGIPLFKMAAESTGGSFSIESELGKGTTTTATFVIDSIDRMPLGNVAETVTSLIMTSPQIDFKLIYRVDDREFIFDTAEFKTLLEGIPIESAEIINYLKEYLDDNIKIVNGGMDL